MIIYVKSQNIEYWKVTVKGPSILKDANGVVKKELDYDHEDWKHDQINANAIHLIFCSLTQIESHFVRVPKRCQNDLKSPTKVPHKRKIPRSTSFFIIMNYLK